MRHDKRLMETVIHGIFLVLGLVTVGCVLMITVYLVISGIPAIRQIGLFPFLFGPVWDSTAAEPKYGILSFILTSIYGTAGAIVLGVPVGFLTAVYLAKARYPKTFPCPGRRQSAGGYYCVGCHDPALHYQGVHDGAGGGAQGV